jgi:hypothetical protein
MSWKRTQECSSPVGASTCSLCDETMRAMRLAVVRSELVRWSVAGAGVPPDPQEAERRLRRALASEDDEPAV